MNNLKTSRYVRQFTLQPGISKQTHAIMNNVNYPESVEFQTSRFICLFIQHVSLKHTKTYFPRKRSPTSLEISFKTIMKIAQRIRHQNTIFTYSVKITGGHSTSRFLAIRWKTTVLSYSVGDVRNFATFVEQLGVGNVTHVMVHRSKRSVFEL